MLRQFIVTVHRHLMFLNVMAFNPGHLLLARQGQGHQVRGFRASSALGEFGRPWSTCCADCDDICCLGDPIKDRFERRQTCRTQHAGVPDRWGP